MDFSENNFFPTQPFKNWHCLLAVVVGAAGVMSETQACFSALGVINSTVNVAVLNVHSSVTKSFVLRIFPLLFLLSSCTWV